MSPLDELLWSYAPTPWFRKEYHFSDSLPSARHTDPARKGAGHTGNQNTGR